MLLFQFSSGVQRSATFRDGMIVWIFLGIVTYTSRARAPGDPKTKKKPPVTVRDCRSNNPERKLVDHHAMKQKF